MSTTYDYVYDYEGNDSNRNNRKTGATGGSYNQNPARNQVNYHSTTTAGTIPYSNRLNNMDPLVNLQHDRIWHKLYDPQDSDKVSQDAENQVCSETIKQCFICFLFR